MHLKTELDVAIDAVKKASHLCASIQHGIMARDIVQKQDRSPVTIADLGCQAFINSRVSKAFPEDCIVGEETTDELEANDDLLDRVSDFVGQLTKTSNRDDILHAVRLGTCKPPATGRFWILDPIDGTKGFLRGDQYAIALALIDQGTVQLGVLGCPNYDIKAGTSKRDRGTVFFAVRGEGAHALRLGDEQTNRIHVDPASKFDVVRFCESVEVGHASHDIHANISRILGITAPPFRIDSQAKYASVAKGDAHIYFRLSRTRGYREKIWDHAAGCLIVEEAGGSVSDFNGNPLDFSSGITLEKNEGILATNGIIHDTVLEAIASVTSS